MTRPMPTEISIPTVELDRLRASNADMLAALQDVANAYQQHFDVMPVAWQTIDHIVSAAIAKATS